MNQKGSILLYTLLGILLLILVGGGAYYLGSRSTQHTSPQLPPSSPVPFYQSPTPTTDQTTNWRTYNYSDVGFSMQYPPTWTSNANVANYAPVAEYLKGSEGSVTIRFGTGFGGGCGQINHQQVQIHNESLDSCHSVNSDGTETWREFGKVISSTMSVDIMATVNAPYTSNRNIVLKILSTITFTNQNQSNATSAPSSSAMNNFPIYPNSQFIGKRDVTPCPYGGAGGYSTCGNTTYTWQSNDNYDQVNSWYAQNKSNSVWICTGGAGQYTDTNNASGITSCSNGMFKYGLQINTINGKTTLILQIPA